MVISLALFFYRFECLFKFFTLCDLQLLQNSINLLDLLSKEILKLIAHCCPTVRFSFFFSWRWSFVYLSNFLRKFYMRAVCACIFIIRTFCFGGIKFFELLFNGICLFEKRKRRGRGKEAKIKPTTFCYRTKLLIRHGREKFSDLNNVYVKDNRFFLINELKGQLVRCATRGVPSCPKEWRSGARGRNSFDFANPPVKNPVG